MGFFAYVRVSERFGGFMSGIFGRLFGKKENRFGPFCSAVVVAAGNSRRMNGVNKLFAEIGGIPVLAHSLITLNESDYISEIIVVCKSEDMVQVGKICKDFELDKVKKVVLGGDTRIISSLCGLAEISKKAELAAVHDGARPFVSHEVISDAVITARSYGAAVPGIPVRDTVKIIVSGQAVSTPERNQVYAIQTPQVFPADILRAALEDALKNGLDMTDDSSAVERLGYKVSVSRGEDVNIKITTLNDLAFGEVIWQRLKD